MNEKRNKILEWGIAIAIIAPAAYIITNSLMSSEIPISQVLKYVSLFVTFFFIPFFLIFGIHYWVLGRMLHNPHPFENFKLGYFGPKSQNSSNQEKHLHALRFYTLSYFFGYFFTLPFFYIFRKLSGLSFLTNTRIFFVFFIQSLHIAPIITFILLIFSQKILGKPIKETWKAILFAGIVTEAYVITYGLFFYHLVLPRLGM